LSYPVTPLGVFALGYRFDRRDAINALIAALSRHAAPAKACRHGDPVGSAILRKQARAQNPDKDEVRSPVGDRSTLPY
jgi:hypothetical protein